MSRRSGHSPAKQAGPPARSSSDAKRVRCAIYTRKSTTHNLDSDLSSLDVQREACEHYVRAHVHEGWELVNKQYDDGGFTGANTDRPAFQELMDDIARRKVDLVLVYKVDRLSRSLLDFAKMMEKFDKAGVEFVSVTQNFSTANALGKLTLNILMSFAQFEREMISERTRDKIRAARKRGKWTGGRAPYGYELVDKALAAHPSDAKGIREIFDLYLEHRSILAVTRTLAHRGKVKRENRQKVSLPWNKQDVLRVLRNPVYAGMIDAEGVWVDGRHEALVPRAVFDKAQFYLNGATTVGGPQRNPEYLLRGILRCSACGGLMSAASFRRTRRTYRYYRCSTHVKRNGCTTKQVPAEAIEDVVIRRLRQEIQKPTLVPEVRKYLRLRADEERRALQMERAELPRSLARLRTEAERVLRQLDSAELANRSDVTEEYERRSKAVTAEEDRLREVNRRLGALDELDLETEWISRTLERFEEVWELLTPDNKGRLLRAIITSVHYDQAGEAIRTVLVPAAVTLDESRKRAS